jgi:D-psicose/D-tagatose/L-ribulose 3-epimerase
MAGKLAISNIAWPAELNLEVLEVLERHGVHDLEIAPSKIWSRPNLVPLSEARRYKHDLARRGFRIVAAQSLLFGRPDLTIFKEEEITRQTLAYLEGIIQLCAELGAEALVFGSPKNRRIGDTPPEQVARVSESFFGALAEYAERVGTVVVLEANPPQYEADFVTRAQEAAMLVRAVNRPGLRLHLDTGCMSMAGDDIDRIFQDHQPLVHHFHISEPWLAPVNAATVDHGRFARCLRAHGYDRWLSIEMRSPEPFSLKSIDDAIAWSRKAYFANE